MLLILFFANPGGRESAEGGQRRGTLPDGVLAVGSGDDPDLGAGRGLVGNLNLQAVGQALVHGAAAGEDDVLQKIFADVDVGLRDRSPSEVLEGHAALTVEIGLEEQLSGLQTGLALDGDL